MPKRQPHLFLSHSSDDKQFVRLLAKDFSSVGVDVWFDDWELQAGDSLHASIARGLTSSRFVGVILSAQFAASRWCKRELDTAFSLEMERKEKRILPLLYQTVEIPVFLKGRVYQDLQGRQYFPSLTLLAGLMHGFSKQALSEAISRKTPKSIESVGAILFSLGWSGRFYIDPDDFNRHDHQIFKYCGVRLKDLSLDDSYYKLIKRMQRDGITIFPLRWPLR